MYTIQSLWTAALLQLSIVFVILANREYRVLEHNMDTYRIRFAAGSNRPDPHMDLAPTLDFTAMGIRPLNAGIIRLPAFIAHFVEIVRRHRTLSLAGSRIA